MGKLLTTAEFVDRCRTLFGNKYGYEKAVYLGYHKKVTLTCPLHGDFEKNVNNLLAGQGCPMCSKLEKRRAIPVADYKKRAVKKWKKFWQEKKCRYDYRLMQPIPAGSMQGEHMVRIICVEHEVVFSQFLNNHLSMHIGCWRCREEYQGRKFIEACRKKYGGFYDYSRVDYHDLQTPVTVVCPLHGEFEILPIRHRYNYTACPQCAVSRVPKKTNSIGIFNALSLEEYLLIREVLVERLRIKEGKETHEQKEQQLTGGARPRAAAPTPRVRRPYTRRNNGQVIFLSRRDSV